METKVAQIMTRVGGDLLPPDQSEVGNYLKYLEGVPAEERRTRGGRLLQTLAALRAGDYAVESRNIEVYADSNEPATGPSDQRKTKNVDTLHIVINYTNKAGEQVPHAWPVSKQTYDTLTIRIRKMLDLTVFWFM